MPSYLLIFNNDDFCAYPGLFNFIDVEDLVSHDDVLHIFLNILKKLQKLF